MEWNQLKNAEAGWDLSLSQMNLLTERVYQRATGPRTFYFPILKPILAVAAMAVLVFGLLLLWPKKPIDEQIVTLPGSSSAAKPGEYVENDTGDETLPPKEETSGGNQTTDPSPDKEEKLPATGTVEQSKMTFSEALAIVKEKATNKNFDKTLTAEERKALSLYLAHENYYYLQGQVDGEIGRLKESGAKEYVLEMKVFSTKEYLGKNLFENLPFGTLSEKTNAKAPGDLDNPYFYPRILGKELSNSADYLKNMTVSNALPDGRATATVALGAKPLTKAQCEELINHFLHMENVTWVELQYQVEDETGNPTAIHKYWETQREMPFEEAKAIVSEKVQKRPDQQLSDKERMAFTVILSTRAKQFYTDYESFSLKFPGENLRPWMNFTAFTTKNGEGISITEDCLSGNNRFDGATLKFYTTGKVIYNEDTDKSFELPKDENENSIDPEYIFGNFSYRYKTSLYGGIKFLNEETAPDNTTPFPSEKQLIEFIHHLMSVECVTALQIKESSVGYVEFPTNY